MSLRGQVEKREKGERLEEKDCGKARMSRIERQGSGEIPRLARLLLILALGLSLLRLAQCVPYKRLHVKSLRLCSRDLSNTLYIVCRDRGYNEPFPYSGEDEPRAPRGPGLVEECCYHSCSFEQLEQYCKPSSEEKRTGGSGDVIELALRIVRLPDSSRRRARSSAENVRNGYVSDATQPVHQPQPEQ
ncbi:hypothetical protein KM043_013943 [Ampulex compressa]|nr:hypothetical protein KM043_013943 [Ampulex compressa]